MSQGKKDETALLKGRAFAIPASLVDERQEEFRKQKIRYKKVMARVNGYEVAACVFTARSSATLGDLLLDVISVAEIRHSDNIADFKCHATDDGMPFFTGKCGTVTIHWGEDGPDKEAAAAQKEQYEPAIVCYRKLLEEFSALVDGIDFHFHMEGLGDIRAPYRETPRCIYIFSNCVPPGEATHYYKKRIFGLPLAVDGEEQLCHQPTPGRGVVIKDNKDYAAQIIGSNFYFLVPTVDCFNSVTSAKIFKALLGVCWIAYQSGEERAKKAEAEPLTRKAFLAAAHDWQIGMLSTLETVIAEDEKKIEHKFREIAELQHGIRQYAQLLEIFEAGKISKNVRSRLAEEWKKILALLDVERLAIVDKGLQVYTKPISIEHNGRMYALGSYVIRINSRGLISVWSENPAHPDRVPHPHIARDGSPCYGNATEAIIRAASTHRYADAFGYVLRWLRFGYTPELARVKIEDWPISWPVSSEEVVKT